MRAGSPATARMCRLVQDSQHPAVTPAASSPQRSSNLHRSFNLKIKIKTIFATKDQGVYYHFKLLQTDPFLVIFNTLGKIDMNPWPGAKSPCLLSFRFKAYWQK